MALARPPSQTSSSSPDGWHGYKYWLANVPYPNGNDSFENPSVLASDDAAFWQIPAGGTNPLVSAPPCDHNNDPDLVYNPATDELWLYYLDTRRSSRCGASYNDNYLKLIKSSDGVHWSEPLTLIDWPLATNPLYVSPTITVVNGTLYLWGGQLGDVYHADGIVERRHAFRPVVRAEHRQSRLARGRRIRPEQE
jgi:hypothetical protein